MKAIGHIYITAIHLYALRIDDPIIIVPAIIGSLLPDTDHHVKTMVGRIIPMYKFYSHRKQVHSIFYGFIFAILSLFISHGYIISISLFLSYLLHLITDRFTSNVPYLFWYPTKQIKKQPKRNTVSKR